MYYTSIAVLCITNREAVRQLQSSSSSNIVHAQDPCAVSRRTCTHRLLGVSSSKAMLGLRLFLVLVVGAIANASSSPSPLPSSSSSSLNSAVQRVPAGLTSAMVPTIIATGSRRSPVSALRSSHSSWAGGGNWGTGMLRSPVVAAEFGSAVQNCSSSRKRSRRMMSGVSSLR